MIFLKERIQSMINASTNIFLFCRDKIDFHLPHNVDIQKKLTLKLDWFSNIYKKSSYLIKALIL